MFMKDIGEFLKKVSQEEPSKQIVDSLVTLIGELCAEVNRLNVLVKNLQNEIAQLKNLPPRPKIEPSKLERPDKTGDRKANWTKVGLFPKPCKS